MAAAGVMQSRMAVRVRRMDGASAWMNGMNTVFTENSKKLQEIFLEMEMERSHQPGMSDMPRTYTHSVRIDESLLYGVFFLTFSAQSVVNEFGPRTRHEIQFVVAFNATLSFRRAE